MERITTSLGQRQRGSQSSPVLFLVLVHAARRGGGEIGTGVEQTESQKELICLELQNQNMFLEEYQSSFPPSRSEGSK